jgi:hypothetical protein
MNPTQLNQRLAKAPVRSGAGYSFRENMPRIELADGESISIQASCNHYCAPRDDEGPWSRVEIGYPSVKPQEEMMEFCEDPNNPTGSVYGYVPIRLACDFINAHGGLKK